MAQHDELLSILNEAISLEYRAAIQYNQHSMLLTGQNKLLYEHLFKDSAQSALGHAKKWGDRIVYLGGVPKAEIGEIRQPKDITDITEMLELALEVEKTAVATYSRAHKVCKHEPTLYMLEDQILDEDKDVEKLQKLLGKVEIARAVRHGKKEAA
jgi:bacterioferritin (cytochrome b1)